VTWDKGGYGVRYRVFYVPGCGWTWQLENHSQVLAQAPQFYADRGGAGRAVRRVRKLTAAGPPVIALSMAKSLANRYSQASKAGALDGFYDELGCDQRAMAVWRAGEVVLDDSDVTGDG
jgi:hypothetical protein